MAEQILQVEGLTARVEDKVILHEVGLTIKKGETHVLMGPNGAGKSTLGYVLTGNPKYSVTEGKILFKGNDITEEAADKRAKAGMFLSFQEPFEVPGLSLESFIRSALSEQGRNKMRVWNFRKELKAAMEVLHMDPSYAGRDLNVGFSGGEKKKSEILQLMMLKPDLAILDETDSGLDVDMVRSHFMKLVKPNDHKFAALHGAVWSGGSFVYVPPGVSVTIPLQSYFRLNALGAGQFEHSTRLAHAYGDA